MKRFSLLYICLASLTLWSCSKSVEYSCAEEAGMQDEITFSATDFTGIELRTDAHVTLVQHDKFSVRAMGDVEILDRLSVAVEYGTLVVDQQGCLGAHTPVEVVVSLPVLTDVIVRGAGHVSGGTDFECKDLRCELEGNGGMDLKATTIHGAELMHNGAGEMKLSLSTPILEVNQSGSGDILLAGETNLQRVHVTGSGSYRAFDFFSTSCTLDLSASGNAEVWVRDILNINITDTGWLYYKGNPSVVRRVRGGGEIRKVE